MPDPFQCLQQPGDCPRDNPFQDMLGCAFLSPLGRIWALGCGRGGMHPQELSEGEGCDCSITDC